MILCRNSSSSSSNNNNNNNNSNGDDDGDGYTHLLTRATARQLKGDVPDALRLTNKAISVMQSKLECLPSPPNMNTNTNRARLQEDVADALLFLGKLHTLENAHEPAMASFSEARDLYQQIETETILQHGDDIDSKQQQQQQQQELRRKELTALSHLASAKSRSFSGGININNNNNDNNRIDVDEIENEFKVALSGLEEEFGYGDGMTNHTAHEWSLFCRSRGDYRASLSILTNTKEQLSKVFGASDPRVLMLNGELAELWQLVPSSSDEPLEKEANDTATNNNNSNSNNNTATPSGSSAEDKAMALLEEALDELPPSSPEARRIFMQLEEWKEAKENNNGGGGGGNYTETVKGITVAFTKGGR